MGFKINDENPLTTIKKFIKNMKNEGYFFTFIKHFNLQIRLKTEELETKEVTEEPETEEQVINFLLPDCVKRRLNELAREYVTNQHKEIQNKKINLEKKIKSSECVICLNKPPNFLFCNCGHIPICVECDEVKSLAVCPVCKTENFIKRMIEY